MVDLDTQCDCALCCSQGHCACDNCNEPCDCLPTCDVCELDSESVEWCGNCGNCREHCADSIGCSEWQANQYGEAL